jgi:superfamily I DNA/RNA helicase
MTFQPSSYQRALFSFIAEGAGSATVKAVAGSGKSTSIVRALPGLPESASVQVFAFNTAIAKEMKAKIAALGEELNRPFKNVRASTFHSVGFNAVCRRLGKKPAEVENTSSKVRTICHDRMIPEDHEMYADFVCKLVGLAKGEGIGCLVPDTDERWYDLIQHHDLFLDDEEATEARAVELARKVLTESNRRAEKGMIDFDDQLYLPLLWRLRLWQNDYVIIDEAQDTNPVRRALAKLALRPGGRLIAVGDPRQAIYGFTGASHDAMDLIQHEFNCVELPLTVSYRCPKAVGELARSLVPYFEVAPAAEQGEVLNLGLKDALKQLGAHDAILCRNTSPLISLAFKLIAEGVGCVVLGKEIGAGLVQLIHRQRARGIDNLLGKLEAFRSREVAKFTAKGEEGKAEAVSDRVACILTVIGSLNENERTIPKLVARLEGLFSDANGVLTLSTMHKAKGREWNVVGIYRPELCPSKWARQEHQYQQELNLQYVAWTRAMKSLIFIQE